MGAERATPGQFTKIAARDYVCFTWFERDRANIRLETPNGREVFDLWDEAVIQAVEDGLSTTPRVLRPSSANWQPHAVRYAIAMGLIKPT
jgi:hypothetical protein